MKNAPPNTNSLIVHGFMRINLSHIANFQCQRHDDGHTLIAFKMERTVARYFMGIVPPAPIYDQVQDLKKYCFEKYGTKGALRSPPHLTLHMPFLWNEKKENLLTEGIASFCQTQAKFKLSMCGFSCFAPRVLFIDVDKNTTLIAFQRELVKFCRVKFNVLNANFRAQPFHPHITIAFRDLKKNRFTEAWHEFSDKPFRADFYVDAIALLKYDGQRWDILCKFTLG